MYANLSLHILSRVSAKVATYRAGITNLNQLAAQFSSTNYLLADPKWRIRNKLPLNPNAYGPLTDGPDYSFLNGKPAPPGKGQYERMQRQQELAKEAVRMIGEIDFAVERHKKLQIEEEERKQKILASKLKPKGSALVKKKIK